MSDRVDSLRERVREPAVDDAAVERVWVGAGRVRGARARRRAAVTVSAAAALVIGAIAARPRSTSAGEGVTRINGESLAFRAIDRAQSIDLSDGSTLTARARTPLAIVANDGARVEWRMGEGAVHFSVRPRGPRRWTIDAGLARISVIGTQFDVERAPHALDVRCIEGTVRVESSLLPEGARVLHAGDAIRVSDAPPEPVVRTVDADASSVTDAAASSTVAVDRAIDDAGGPQPRVARPSQPRADDRAWRSLAQHGEYDRAYALLGHEGVARESSASSPDDLLALADVARLSGHPADAVAPLETLLSRHGRDGAAPLAAYTLGRVLLSLSRAADAAAAFDRALSLGAPRAIEEDARLQLVRARAAAGDRAGAQRAADDFRARYGETRGAQSLQRWLGTTP